MTAVKGSEEEIEKNPFLEVTKKKKKKNKKEKRKRSQSTESCCSSTSKKHKKSKKDGQTSKINPIFLRTHNDNSTIVNVVCEDYDKRNRIKIMKVDGNCWRSIPLTEPSRQWSSLDMLEGSPTIKTINKEDKLEIKSQVETETSLIPKEEKQCENLDENNLENSTSFFSVASEKISEKHDYESEKFSDDESEHEEIKRFEPRKFEPKDLDDEAQTFAPKEFENKSDKLELKPDERNFFDTTAKASFDENHNNEFDPEPFEDDEFCKEDDSVDKRIKDLIGELEESAMDMPETVQETVTAKEEHIPEGEYLQDHSELMNQLEEMCHGIITTERLKQEIQQPESIYGFVPEKNEECKSVEIKPEISGEAPINLVVQEKEAEEQGAQLDSSEMEGLDILWRLPEGTTIHHSKSQSPIHETAAKPAHQPKPAATISLVSMQSLKEPVNPVQDEPLNLGKPKQPEKQEIFPICKIEEPPQMPQISVKPPQMIKADTKYNDSKLLELLTPPLEKSDALAQLKEILNDPEVNVPDPLLVPRERLQALIANPAKEIPRLLAQSQQVKYPVLEADLLVVSLAHLHFLLQNSSGKEEEKLYQQFLGSQLGRTEKTFDPAVLNQMLWLPYLSGSTNPQDLITMMMSGYPYNWASQRGYDYQMPSQPQPAQQQSPVWPEMRKPGRPKGYSDLYKANAFNPRPRAPPNHPPCRDTYTANHQRRIKSNQKQPHSQFKQDHWPIPQHHMPDLTRVNQQPRPQVHQTPQTSRALSDFSKPKLKVRDHLIDPNLRPKLLKFDDSHLHSHNTKFPDPNHPHLWHPLFSSHEGKAYTPWQWTTPVTVSGE